jgi:uncharacterized protein with PQ loop repeat
MTSCGMKTQSNTGTTSVSLLATDAPFPREASQLVMTSLLTYAPVAATCFAVPQFLPQIRKLAASHDTSGLSWPWAALTAVNNAAWMAYFTLAHYLTALLPSASVTLLAGMLAVMLTRRSQAKAKTAALAGTWAVTLAAAGSLAGRTGLGTLLTAAFILQVTPSVWTAYRTPRPTGVSTGTWLLILGELACWLAFGLHKSDPRLLILGATGVTASLLMLARIRQASGSRPATPTYGDHTAAPSKK